jgi:hypothetical protein
MNKNYAQPEHQELPNSGTTTSGDVITLTIAPRIADLGEFSVRRLLPSKTLKTVGPWIFFDEMGPAEFAPGSGIAVRPHPHIGLATVTYLFEGEILHRDSLGCLQAIRPGDVNLMVAGSGIVHSERERTEVTAVAHRLHGLQLWLALPQEQEEIAPAFYHVPQAQIPALDINGVQLRVIMGSAYGVTSPVPVFSETLYIEAFLQPGQQLRLPETSERALYLVSGQVKICGTELGLQTLTVLQDTAGIVLEAVTAARIALIGGAAIGPRFINWNFVSSSKARLEQAIHDWQAGKFPKVPGDESEFIPYPV